MSAIMTIKRPVFSKKGTSATPHSAASDATSRLWPQATRASRTAPYKWPPTQIAAIAAAGLLKRLLTRRELRSVPMDASTPVATTATAGPSVASAARTKTSETLKV